MIISLEKMEIGQSAVIKSIDGGRGVVFRMEALGLRPGKLISKVSAQFWGGPVTVSVDGRSVAMGRGLASKISVELPEHE